LNVSVVHTRRRTSRSDPCLPTSDDCHPTSDHCHAAGDHCHAAGDGVNRLRSTATDTPSVPTTDEDSAAAESSRRQSDSAAAAPSTARLLADGGSEQPEPADTPTAIADRFSVEGQTAVVTGASSGIGRAIAETFAADGADVVICSREQENVDPVAEAISAGPGGECVAVECDVTDPSAVDALIEVTVDEFGSLDVLVNNAGASFMASFDDISANGFQTILDINLAGTATCAREAAGHLADGGGVVINLSSVAGQRGAPYMSHYAAAKAGIENLTRSLAIEWADRDVRVTCIAPGYVATPGVERQMGVSADEIDRETVDRRVGESREIADLARFLASDAASYVNGETVVAQGVPPGEDLPS
jgi:3-oxoacyl-[acyl-carrier protein] reductase